MTQKQQTTETDRMRGIHLDMKYHVPRKAYLNEWARRLPEYGINAILIEYEDAFPFRKYPFLASPDAFQPEELEQFLSVARGAGLTVIPLVQTYAHLEFALAHEELAHLRERPEILAKVCCRKPEAAAFVKELLDEVMAYHEPDAYFHLGGDEVWHTGWCDACARHIDEVGPIRMWTEHETPLIEFVSSRGKRPIVWDDIFWKDFESVGKVGLPPQTVLHAWNYNITSLKPKSGDSGDMEWGGAGGVLQQVDLYRNAGFDTIAGPCCNIGQLFPRHTQSLKNTQVWARKVRASGMLGVLNTAWAVFHVPLSHLNLYLAATGALCRDPGLEPDEAWVQSWLAREFGGAAGGVPEALETLSAGWEIPAPEYGRPFTPLVYGYMNMVFHYPGRHGDRQRRGPYPHDWDEIDFVAMYRRGVDAARAHTDQAKINRELDARLATFPAATAAMRRLADGATRRREEAESMAVFAELKALSLRVFAHLFRGEGDAAELRREFERLKGPVRQAIERAWEPLGAARMWRAFCEPIDGVLNEEHSPAGTGTQPV